MVRLNVLPGDADIPGRVDRDEVEHIGPVRQGGGRRDGDRPGARRPSPCRCTTFEELTSRIGQARRSRCPVRRGCSDVREIPSPSGPGIVGRASKLGADGAAGGVVSGSFSSRTSGPAGLTLPAASVATAWIDVRPIGQRRSLSFDRV